MSLSSTLEQDAIEAREKELFGKPPRIALLGDNELGPEASKTIADVREVMRLPQSGDIPDFFRMLLRHPALFRAQMDIGIMIVSPDAAIPRREAELAILRLAWLVRAPFEWGEHVNIGKKFGVTDEEVERITEGSAAPGWPDHERAIIKGVEELLEDTYLSDTTWGALAKTWNEAQMLEFPVLVGLYLMTAMQQNSIRLPLMPGNPGMKRR
jgi:4-carboxymuconolactone decarboxylase